jgi:small subunit ribosomal protein S17
MSSTEHRRELVGEVVSDRMDKTVVVLVSTKKRHPLYGKYIRSSKRVKVHDAENQCRVGDNVRVVESRPLSREKRWRLLEIMERSD